jgi:hypothetical protein
MIITLGELTLMDSVGKGGQGTVYELDRVLLRSSALQSVNWRGRAVVKVYDQYLDVAALNAIHRRTDWALRLPPDARAQLYRAACWPLAAVASNGRLAGIVMPDERERYAVGMTLPSGGHKQLLMSLEHLLVEDGYPERRFGLTVDTRVRARIAEQMSASLAVLHRHAIVVSDFSHRNVLAQLIEPYPVTVIDCDSMRFQGHSVLSQVETPDWEIPHAWGEDAITRAADSYKLGLAILRLFARDQTVRELQQAEAHVPLALRALLGAALGSDPRLRPSAGRWQGALREVLATPLNSAYPGPKGRARHAKAGAANSPQPPVFVIPGQGAAGPTVWPLPAGMTTGNYRPPTAAPGGPVRSPANTGAGGTAVVGAVRPAPNLGAGSWRAQYRRFVGPVFAGIVVISVVIAALAAISSPSSPTTGTGSSQLLANTLAAHHLVALSGGGEASWIQSHGGRLWNWNPDESRLRRVTERPPAEPRAVYATVSWRGRYRNRHSVAVQPATSITAASSSRSRPAASRSTGSRSSASSRTATGSSRSAAETTRPATRPSSSAGGGALEGAQEPSAPSHGSGSHKSGGLEGAAESEAHPSSGGGLTGGT